ncbi:MAG: rhodanese-like domain-containing protein [Proteobacteria bacterium]|nr:rhodanese-like domain-containing protein [Pseudomonadota bacterium]
MFGRKKNAVSVAVARDMADNDDWTIIDVRTKLERKDGHIPGSIHYSLDSLNQRLPKLKGKKVLAVCRSGSRSATAVRILDSNGIEAMNIKGGMNAWNRAGLPTRKGK